MHVTNLQLFPSENSACPPMHFARLRLDFRRPCVSSAAGRRSSGTSLRNALDIRGLGGKGRAKEAGTDRRDAGRNTRDACAPEDWSLVRFDGFWSPQPFCASPGGSVWFGLAEGGSVYGPVWDMRFLGRNGKKVRFGRFGRYTERGEGVDVPRCRGVGETSAGCVLRGAYWGEGRAGGRRSNGTKNSEKPYDAG
jgi:hypothetical protein